MVEGGGEVTLDGPPVGDVHVPPQRPPPLGELDDDRTVIDARAVTTDDPTLFLEAVETAAETGADQAQLVGQLARAGVATSALQRGEHVEPSEREVPFGP